MPEHFSEETFNQAIQSGVVLVDLWATWCGPCRMIAPIIEELAAEYSGRITVGKIDVDECPAIAETYGVDSIPTLLFFKDGAEAGRLVGYRQKAEIAQKIDSLL